MNKLAQTQNPQETKQNLIIAIVVAVGLVYLANWFSNYFYFDEVASQISVKQQELNVLQDEHKNLETIKSNLQALEKKSFNLEDAYKALSPLVPQEKELSDILAYLHQAGVQRGLRLSHFSQSQKISRQGALSQIPITVSVLGQDDDVSRYLSDFTRFNRILNIDSVKLTEETNTQYAGNTNAEIRFSAYLSDPVGTATTNQTAKN